MKRAFIFILVTAVLVLAACAAGNVPPPDNASPQQAIPDVVARVNGSDITRADYEAALVRLSGTGVIAQAMSDQVLNTLIEQRIIEQAAVELNVSVTEADIDIEINALKALTTDWSAWLSENAYTEADFRSAIASNLLTQRVREAVLAQIGDVTTIRTVHARHILVASEADANTVLSRLNNGEMFDALAAELSRDVTTKDIGGNLGFFIRSDLTTPELADRVFSLQAGEITGPVQTALGWHIVQTLEFGERPVAEGGEALALEQHFVEWIAARRQAANIELFL